MASLGGIHTLEMGDLDNIPATTHNKEGSEIMQKLRDIMGYHAKLCEIARGKTPFLPTFDINIFKRMRSQPHLSRGGSQYLPRP